MQKRISEVEIKNSGEAKKRKKEILEFLKDEELQLHIEQMSPSQLDRILEIEKSSFNQSDAYSQKEFNELYEKHRGGFIVATIMGDVIGYAVGYVENGSGLVDSIAVEPEFMQHGIGRKLLTSLLEKIQKAGADDCLLEVRTTNNVAISFYQKMHFQIVKTLPKYYEDGSDAYQMKRTLRLKKN